MHVVNFDNAIDVCKKLDKKVKSKFRKTELLKTVTKFEIEFGISAEFS